MIENLFDSINALLLQHPNMLHLMYKLFWLKYWVLIGIMARFIYLAYAGSAQKNQQNGVTSGSGNVLIA